MQHLDRTSDFVVAADHRIELTHAGALGEVDAVFLECLALAFGVGAVDVLAATHGVDGRLQRLAAEAVLPDELASIALVVGQRQQEQLARDELVAALDGLFLGRLQQRAHIAVQRDLFLPVHLRQLLDCGLGACQQSLYIDARALQQGLGAVFLAQHGNQHVGRGDVGVIVAKRQCLGFAQGFLEFGGEFVHSHVFFSVWLCS